MTDTLTHTHSHTRNTHTQLTHAHVLSQVNDAVSEAESILRETLSIPLKQEMVNAFDDFW